MPRLSRRSPFRRATFVAVVIVVLIYRFWPSSLESEPAPLADSQSCRVERVVDGDTLLLATGQRIRLQGVDTPETKHPTRPVEPWGPEATVFTTEFIGTSQIMVHLGPERVDRYGRFLAFVYVDDRMLNEELVRAGLATAETGYRYDEKFKKLFRQAEQ